MHFPFFSRVLSGSYDGSLCLWELDWEYEFPGIEDWDEDARVMLRNFLTLHTQYAAGLPPDRTPTDDEITLSLTRRGRSKWNDSDFEQLLQT
jgi:hypothetical protein